MFHEVKEWKNCRKDAFLASWIKFWEWPYWIFPKALIHDFWAKLQSFIDRFFSRSSRENFLAILKSAKNVEKALFKTVDFGCGHIGFFQRVNSGFRGKIGKSPFNCVFVDIESKKMFHEVKECKNCRKDAFLTRSILGMAAVLDSSKGVITPMILG